MQIVSETAEKLVNNYSKITLNVYIDGAKLDVGIGACSYTASCGNDEEFSFGNACAAGLNIVLGATLPNIKGSRILATWCLNDMEYPLITGIVEKPTVSAGCTTVEAWDDMYYGGSTIFAPEASLLTDCDAAQAFAFVAVCMDVTPEPATLQMLEGITIAGGFGSAPEGISNASAAGYIAGLLGGNALMTRDGLLAIRVYTDTGWVTEPYSGEASADGTDFTVTGLTFQRDDVIVTVDTDGNETQKTQTTEFGAGDGTLLVSNPLADQASADRAFSALKNVTIRPGMYAFPGGLLLEPGNIITVESMDGSYKVAAVTVTMSIDGGVKTTVSCGGEAISGGSPGVINQTLRTLASADERMKLLIAANKSSIASIKVQTSGIEAQVSSIRTEFDGLQIGGRNLIRSSEDLSDGSYAFTDAMAFAVEYDGAGEVAISAPAIRVSYLDDGDIAITADAVNTAYDEEGNVSIGSSGMGVWESCRTESPCGDQALCAKLIVEQTPAGFVIPEIMRAGQEYTFSFWARSEAGGSVTTCGEEFATLTQWEKHSVTFTAETQALELTFHAPDTYYLYHPKLELGNRATDWTPAPEDTDSAIAAITERVTELSVTADGITAAVEAQQSGIDGIKNQLTTVEQKAEGITATVTSIQNDGVSKVATEKGFTFDDKGLTISDTSSDITNTVNEKGMYVTRDKGTDNETDMLVANADGVKATDLTARNYLIVGDHARFEDYTDGTDAKRTACFWIEKEGS